VINLHEPQLSFATIERICDELDLGDPRWVREIRIRAPRKVEVIRYQPNELGAKHILASGLSAQSGVATEILTFPVEVVESKNGDEAA
jgi:hypothetical protein